MGGKECERSGFPSRHQRWVPHSTLLTAVSAPATAQAAEGRRHLINVSGKLRLYCYSRRMAPFISAPSAQAHLLLPRQPTRTQQVCNSPPLGVLSSRGCSGTRGAHSSSGSRRSAGEMPKEACKWMLQHRIWTSGWGPGVQHPSHVGEEEH